MYLELRRDDWQLLGSQSTLSNSWAPYIIDIGARLVTAWSNSFYRSAAHLQTANTVTTLTTLVVFQLRNPMFVLPSDPKPQHRYHKQPGARGIIDFGPGGFRLLLFTHIRETRRDNPECFSEVLVLVSKDAMPKIEFNEVIVEGFEREGLEVFEQVSNGHSF